MHEVCSPPVVHRSFKSANILLDDELNPHVSDCGLAALSPSGSEREVCPSSNSIIGSLIFSWAHIPLWNPPSFHLFSVPFVLHHFAGWTSLLTNVRFVSGPGRCRHRCWVLLVTVLQNTPCLERIQWRATCIVRCRDAGASHGSQTSGQVLAQLISTYEHCSV